MGLNVKVVRCVVVGVRECDGERRAAVVEVGGGGEL